MKSRRNIFSRLSSGPFRAARLVVDVGLHAKGWSRAQAIKYLVDTAMSSEDGAALEVDRYISRPRPGVGLQICSAERRRLAAEHSPDKNGSLDRPHGAFESIPLHPIIDAAIPSCGFAVVRAASNDSLAISSR